jgi:hypothetical protein
MANQFHLPIGARLPVYFAAYYKTEKIAGPE